MLHSGYKNRMIFFPAASRLMPRRAWERHNFINCMEREQPYSPPCFMLPINSGFHPWRADRLPSFYQTTLNNNCLYLPGSICAGRSRRLAKRKPPCSYNINAYTSKQKEVNRGLLHPVSVSLFRQAPYPLGIGVSRH